MAERQQEAYVWYGAHASFCETFYTTPPSFYQDRLGTNRGRAALKQAGCVSLRFVREPPGAQGSKEEAATLQTFQRGCPTRIKSGVYGCATIKP